MTGDDEAGPARHLLETPDLADALASDRFKQFLDHMPVAIAVSELAPDEIIVYANLEFERLTGLAASQCQGQSWTLLPGVSGAPEPRPLAAAITEDRDYVGAFAIPGESGAFELDAWSNVITDDDDQPVFRLVALVERVAREDQDRADLAREIEEKDTQLRELQHRVKNNLQMITSLIRVEARGIAEGTLSEHFDRLAGRVEAMALLYRALTAGSADGTVDLGVYLGEIATAVMHAHAVEGIHLNLQVDTWPVSINVAMPAGLVVNELLTNSLKHAFAGRDGGTITLHSLAGPEGCRVLVADDGVGLPAGSQWPGPGKLSSLIVRSLQNNARARIEVHSAPGQGVQVTIDFACAPASDGGS